MYRLFAGPARILRVRNRRPNCKAFAGKAGTVERGTPGLDSQCRRWTGCRDPFLRKRASASSAPVRAFDCRPACRDARGDLGKEGIHARRESPAGLFKGTIDSEDFVAKAVRHEQSTLCLEQVDVFAIHNGRVLNEGKKLELPPIIPYSGIDSPVVHEIPEQLELDNGKTVSTTEGGTNTKGRLILRISLENMPNAYRNLRPRWQIV
jgi:hypothetical protein